MSKKVPKKFTEILNWEIPPTFISYRISKFKQSNGKIRKLEIPNEGLATVQKIISKYLTKVYTPTLNKAFSKGRCYLDAVFSIMNGINQTNDSFPENPVFYRVDIKDFFQNTTSDMFKKEMLIRRFDEELVDKLIKICFYNGRLPTGSPSSPVISSLASEHLDRRLVHGLCDKVLRLERYADDYFILFNNEDNFRESVPLINYIMNDYGYAINKKKTRKINVRSHLKVMGLVCSFNDDAIDVSIPRWRRAEILNHINECDEATKDGLIAWANSISDKLTYESSNGKLGAAHHNRLRLSKGTNKFLDKIAQ